MDIKQIKSEIVKSIQSEIVFESIENLTELLQYKLENYEFQNVPLQTSQFEIALLIRDFLVKEYGYPNQFGKIQEIVGKHLFKEDNTDYTKPDIKLVLDSPSFPYFFKIHNELEKAKKFPPFASLHEGYAVMKEEVEEFWELVKCFKYTNSEIDLESLEEVEGELIQIAAMAVKNLQLVETMKAKIQEAKG
mgnify:CR=1 FL=1